MALMAPRARRMKISGLPINIWVATDGMPSGRGVSVREPKIQGQTNRYLFVPHGRMGWKINLARSPRFSSEFKTLFTNRQPS